MEVILLLIAVSLLIALLFLVGFFWAVGTGQYDDEVTPAIRILFDDPKPSEDDQTTDSSGH